MSRHVKKAKARRPGKPKLPGACIFCGLGNLSKEHLWPQWAQPLLHSPPQRGPHRVELVIRENKTNVLSHFVKERQGHITTKQVRAVCAKCNSEWMSAIESEVKPIATPLILGQRLILTQDMQATLAVWATLKLMVAEQTNKSDAVFAQAERDAFREKRIIPSYLRLWIAQCFSDKWCNAYMRHAATLGLDPNQRPSDGAKNTLATAFGIGELFLYAMGSTAEGIDLRDFFQFGDELKPLWPLSGQEMMWPPDSAINDNRANRVALALDALIDSPRTHWKPLRTG